MSSVSLEPADAEVRAAILKRASARCEWPGCRVRHDASGYWARHPDIFVEAPLHADSLCIRIELKVVPRVLDFNPNTCHLDNLWALCQRHLAEAIRDHKRQKQKAAASNQGSLL